MDLGNEEKFEPKNVQYKMAQWLWKTIWQFLKKIKIEWSYNSITLFVKYIDIRPKTKL